jgi:hypothetical protein
MIDDDATLAEVRVLLQHELSEGGFQSSSDVYLSHLVIFLSLDSNTPAGEGG